MPPLWQNTYAYTNTYTKKKHATAALPLPVWVYIRHAVVLQNQLYPAAKMCWQRKCVIRKGIATRLPLPQVIDAAEAKATRQKKYLRLVDHLRQSTTKLWALALSLVPARLVAVAVKDPCVSWLSSHIAVPTRKPSNRCCLLLTGSVLHGFYKITELEFRLLVFVWLLAWSNTSESTNCTLVCYWE